jgi:hypothetical protein
MYTVDEGYNVQDHDNTRAEKSSRARALPRGRTLAFWLSLVAGASFLGLALTYWSLSTRWQQPDPVEELRGIPIPPDAADPTYEMRISPTLVKIPGGWRTAGVPTGAYLRYHTSLDPAQVYDFYASTLAASGFQLRQGAMSSGPYSREVTGPLAVAIGRSDPTAATASRIPGWWPRIYRAYIKHIINLAASKQDDNPGSATSVSVEYTVYR